MVDQACGLEAATGDDTYKRDCEMTCACICSAECTCDCSVCKEAVTPMK